MPGNHPKACPEPCIYGDHRERGKGVDGVIPTKAQSQWPAWGSLPETPSRCFLLLHGIVCLLRKWQACRKTMWDARPSSEGKAPVSLPPDNYTHSSGTFLAHDSSKCVFKLLSLLKPQRSQQQDDRLERGGYMLSSRVLNEPISEMSRWLTRRRVRWDSFNSIWNEIHAFLLQTRTSCKLSLGIVSLRTALQSPLSAPCFSLPSGIPKSISEDLNL